MDLQILRKKILVNFGKILIKQKKVTKDQFLKQIVTYTWDQQRSLIKKYCKNNPNAFVELFLTHHLRTGSIAKFHSDWIRWIIIDKTKYLMIVAPREHSKSTVISLFAPLHLICHNLKKFILIASDSKEQAELLLGSLKRELEENHMLRLVYGNLVIPELQDKYKTKKWTATEILTTNKVRLKAVSNLEKIRGLKDVNQRPDLVIFDDLENETDSESEVKRMKTWEWFTQTALSVGTSDTQYVMVGTFVHKEGVIGKIIDDIDHFGWKVSFNKVVNEKGEPLWPEYWPLERIEEKKKLIGPVAFEREFMLNPEMKESYIFNIQALENAKERGRTLQYFWSYQMFNKYNYKFVVGGVDLCVKAKEENDEFAMVTLGIKENGDRVLVNIVHGKYTPNVQKETIMKQFNRFDHDLILIENNAYQDALVQDLQESTDLPVKGFQTTKKKYDPELGVYSLEILFENNKITLPYYDMDITSRRLTDRLVEQCKRYPIGHTGDILMALWFANEASFMVNKTRHIPVDVVNDLFPGVTRYPRIVIA